MDFNLKESLARLQPELRPYQSYLILTRSLKVIDNIQGFWTISVG
jgi:hypothetical protein